MKYGEGLMLLHLEIVFAVCCMKTQRIKYTVLYVHAMHIE